MTRRLFWALIKSLEVLTTSQTRLAMSQSQSEHSLSSFQVNQLVDNHRATVILRFLPESRDKYKERAVSLRISFREKNMEE